MARRMKVLVELQGQAEMRRALARLQLGAIARIKAQVKASAENIEREAKARVPVDEGTTRDSIRVVYSDFGMTASIGSAWFNARFIEQGTQRQPARPFLNPAFQAERNVYLKGIEDALNDAGKEASTA